VRRSPMVSDNKHNLSIKKPSQMTDDFVITLSERSNNGLRVVLYAGTFEPYQGLNLLVDASQTIVHAHPSVRFLCIGGNQMQIESIKARAHQHGVIDYFLFPGTIPPEDVKQHFKIASILVSPRIYGTNTPLKIYSYLRSGVPILATNILSHTQVLTPEVALLVEPRPEALAAGILRLLGDSHLSRRLAKNALRLAEDAYSPDAYHGKVAEVFSFLAARSRQRT